ncbi:unnamed protein product [Ectocarpus sp. 6 AP-2014]
MRQLFEPPSQHKPPTLLNAVCCSVVPLLLIAWNQMFLILGITGMPSTWLDVLTLDLGLDDLLKESKSSITSFISMFGTLLAFVRPTIPGDSPRVLRTLLPLVAWVAFSDEATVTPDQLVDDDSPESFFYVNGICTTRRMALATGAELSKMFNKNVTVVHNPTDSFIIDIFECVFAKLWTGQSFATSRPCALLMDRLLEALRDPTKTKASYARANKQAVVLIAHSQGTIIASDALRRLWTAVDKGELAHDEMKKLEIYNLANAAHWMDQTEDRVPYIESICNQRDTVGMLGANAPESVKQSWNIRIAGPVVYPTTNRWGHMISAHYLKHLKNGDYPGSKLHTYMNTAKEPEYIVAASH